MFSFPLLSSSSSFSTRFITHFIKSLFLVHLPKMQLNIKFFFSYFIFIYLLISSSDYCISQEDGYNYEDINRSHFPVNFLFGTSTSSYQIEGASLEDGRSLSNWDIFTHVPGNILNDDNGDVADDHYHRFLDDIKMMDSLGVNTYRFSISWSRILPRGRFGEVNPKGIKFYNNIIDNLLSRGIDPFVTIYHQDLPQELEDRYGSWLSPLMQEDFVHLSEICFKYFGDRVKYWVTLNEPNLYTELTYTSGLFPPARCSEPFGNCMAGNSDIEPLIVMHNMILSHAKAVKLYRERYQALQGGSIGIIASAYMYEPLRDEELDKEAASRVLAFTVGWMLDPLVHGDYPTEMRKYLGTELPIFTNEDIKYVTGSIDFIGINHYSTLYAQDCLNSSCNLSQANHPIRGFVYTTGLRDGIPIGEETGLETCYVVPRGMEKIVNYLKVRYNNMPMYVTENGYSSINNKNDELQDLLQDVKRINFHKKYLAALLTSIKNGADVRGYFIWSLMDNFEWRNGYSTRFGLYHVDHTTLNRTPKLSANWYKHFLTNFTSLKQHLIPTLNLLL